MIPRITAIYFVSFFWILHVSGQGFSDVTTEVNIEHIHVSSILMGGGTVFIDYDNDGWQDIFMTGGEAPDKLYRNIEGETFEDVSFTALPFIKGSNVSSGVVALDFDNDNCRDLFITTLSESFPNVLLRNNCDGTFTNVSTPFGITHPSWSMGAAAYDVNQDGWQDIYVINYLKEPELILDDTGVTIGFNHTCFQDFLYLNDGTGKFQEVALERGLDSDGCGLAISTLDFLEDGSKGFYIANDFGEWVQPNALLDWNDPDRSSVDFGLDIGLYGMGIAIGDIDNDLDFDLYVTNIGKNALMINDNNNFQNKAAQFGVENEFAMDTLFAISWGTFFADLDNDRDQDLFVANGSPELLAEFIRGSPLDPSKAYENQNGTMVDVSEDWGLENFGSNRGAIYGDYNNDGMIDVLLTLISANDLGSNENLTYKLYENQGNSNHFLKLFLEGEIDKDAYGSVVSIHAGNETRKQILLSSATHASQHEKSLIFGLSTLSTVDSVTVNWPDGDKQSFIDLESDRTYLLMQSDNSKSIMGCTDPDSKNYDPDATVNHGCIAKPNSTIKPIADSNLEIYNYEGQLHFRGNGIDQHLDIQIYNLIGQQVFNKQNHDFSMIDLSSMSSGIYSAIITFEESLYSKKFVVINE